MDQQPQMPNQAPMGAKKPAVSKWLWITLVIVILIGGGFFSWYYLMGPGKKAATTTTTAPMTTDVTANWTTYTNATYGFSFKYPTDWTKTKPTSGGTMLFQDLFSTADTIDGDVPGAAFEVTVDKIAVADIVSTDVSRYSAATNYAKTTTTVAGQAATKITYTDAYNYGRTIIVFSKDSNSYVLAGINKDSVKKNGVDLGMFGTIVPSFKFTTATAATSTADWKTYTNTDYGFSLTFTDDWKGYQIQKDTSASLGTKKAVYNLKVPSSLAGASGYENLIDISVWNIADWNTAAADIKNGEGGVGQSDITIGELIGKTSQYAVSYHVTYQDISSTVHDKYNPLLPALIKTFATIK